jgi:hypothetical protein
MEDDKMKEYIRLRLKENCGHREASRRAGYSATASKRAVQCYKFLQNAKPRVRSQDPKPEEIMQFLLDKLQLLNDKMEGLKSEMLDVRLKLRAMNIAKEI